MTPEARVSAAIGVIDQIMAGAHVGRVLTAWGRANRYAGSGDRAAIADHVYEVLRRRRSLAALGGGCSGRCLMVGLLRANGQDPAAIFSGARFAPPPLTEAERVAGQSPASDSAEDLDLPDWVLPLFRAALGAQAEAVARALSQRAEVHLRVNLARIGREDARAVLAAEGVETTPHPLSPTALTVRTGARRLRNAAPYRDGRVELQDAASQAVADMVPLTAGQSLLDYCAGGGGKTLAVAGRVRGRFFAHDAVPARMGDLPSRAERAGQTVHLLETTGLVEKAPYDTVLVDAPCSGSGSWRRDPQGKWHLTREGLDRLCVTQADILRRAADLVAPGGHLVYATCSLLDPENGDQVDRFLAGHPEFEAVAQRALTPLDGADGFFCAVLARK